jgi:hypothetical protein
MRIHFLSLIIILIFAADQQREPTRLCLGASQSATGFLSAAILKAHCASTTCASVDKKISDYIRTNIQRDVLINYSLDTTIYDGEIQYVIIEDSTVLDPIFYLDRLVKIKYNIDEKNDKFKEYKLIEYERAIEKDQSRDLELIIPETILCPTKKIIVLIILRQYGSGLYLVEVLPITNSIEKSDYLELRAFSRVVSYLFHFDDNNQIALIDRTVINYH